MAKLNWCWRRWIVPAGQDLWMTRLKESKISSWVFIERPGRKRVVLEAYLNSRSAAKALVRKWSGRVHAVNIADWLKASRVPPTQIGRSFEIVHHQPADEKLPILHRLFIPHGIAFGSGEHATTYMLLRALVHHEDWNKTTVLDLGTGSGVLALTARRLGARKIAATDFDPDAVRTSRQNEALNFPRPLIRWRCADVRKLRSAARYDLVLANLFSGILLEAAPQITRCLSPGGQLWLSGILLSQQAEVTAAYGKLGLKLIRACRRGKWIMLQWARP